MKRTAAEIAEGVRLIKGVDFECCIWLVEGREKALLVDTGLGLGDLRGEAEALTDKPLTVVNTHGHGDHSGGNYAFDRVYMHPAAVPDAEAALEMTEMFASREELDAIRRRMEEKPAELCPLREGDVFDLGGITLEVIETPGHTPGDICLLDRKHRGLFAGDTPGDIALYDRAAGLLFSGDSMVQSMDVLLVVPQTVSVEAYARSLRRLAALEGLKGFCSGHDQRLMPRSFLLDCLACAEGILAGTADTRETDPGLPGIQSCLRSVSGEASILWLRDKIR